MKIEISFVIVIIILLIIGIYLNRMNNIDSIILESFITPKLSTNTPTGSSMLYGWKQQTYNPNWSMTPIDRCCPCKDDSDSDEEDS